LTHFVSNAGESTFYRSFGLNVDSLTFERHVGMLYAGRCGYVVKKKIKTMSKYIQPCDILVLHTFADRFLSES